MRSESNTSTVFLTLTRLPYYLPLYVVESPSLVIFNVKGLLRWLHLGNFEGPTHAREGSTNPKSFG